MSYLYQNRCFDTVQQLHEFVAADCPVVSGGAAIKCTPSATDIFIEKTDLSLGTTTSYNYVPAQITCDPSLTDLTAVIWDVSLILIAAFSIAVIIKQLKKS